MNVNQYNLLISFFKFSIIYSFKEEKGPEAEKTPVHWFTPHIPAIFIPGPGSKPGAGNVIQVSHMGEKKTLFGGMQQLLTCWIKCSLLCSHCFFVRLLSNATQCWTQPIWLCLLLPSVFYNIIVNFWSILWVYVCLPCTTLISRPTQKLFWPLRSFFSSRDEARLA